MTSSHAAGFGVSIQPGLRWSWHLGALAIVAAIIIALFWSDVFNAVQVWWFFPTYSHCFLILPISGWLVWQMRGDLAVETPTISPAALLAIPPILLVWLAANFATINELRQFAVVALFEIAIVAILGPRIFRTVLFPALYLFFLVPFGQYLIPPMQSFATWFTDTGLSLLNVPHFTEGTTIELTNGRFEIAEACAGLRFLIATVALGALFAHMSYRGWKKRLMFLAACIAVPLIGNGLRCLGIIELAHLSNNQIATGADHLVYGWIFNTAILLFLLIIGLRFRDPVISGRIVSLPARQIAFSRGPLLYVALATVLTSAVGPAFADWHERQPITVHPEMITDRFGLGGWTERLNSTWHPEYSDADIELMTRILPGKSANAVPIDAAVAYYARNRDGRSLLAASHQLWDTDVWHQVEANAANVRLGPDRVLMNEAIISSGSRQRLVWWTYWMAQRFTTSSLAIKLLQLKTAFAGNESAALIAFSLPIDGATEDARKQLESALAELTILPRTSAAPGQIGLR